MQDSGWYHGPLTRQEAEARVRGPEALPGDYLVAGRTLLVLTMAGQRVWRLGWISGRVSAQ